MSQRQDRQDPTSGRVFVHLSDGTVYEVVDYVVEEHLVGGRRHGSLEGTFLPLDPDSNCPLCGKIRVDCWNCGAVGG